jgi:hypothetical protein
MDASFKWLLENPRSGCWPLRPRPKPPLSCGQPHLRQGIRTALGGKRTRAINATALGRTHSGMAKSMQRISQSRLAIRIEAIDVGRLNIIKR